MELHRLCAYMFGWFQVQITQWVYLSQSQPAFCIVLQVSKDCILFVPTCRPETRNVSHPIKKRMNPELSHRTPSLAHMFICTPPIPPFVMSCFIPASITQLSLSSGIAYRLITFQEFNVMTGGQANF